MTPFTYRFRPLSISDLPLVGQWLSHPHVAEWWGDPVPALAAIKDHLADPAMNLFIVSFGDMPIGYKQSYDPHAERDHPLHDQPMGTLGIDQFIGEPALIGRGHGSAFIRAFVEQSFAAGVPRVVTDPNPQCACDPRLCQSRILSHRPARDAFRRGAVDGLRRAEKGG